MPAPTRAKPWACSYTSTSKPARRSVAAAARPPMPAPTIAKESFFRSIFRGVDFQQVGLVYRVARFSRLTLSGAISGREQREQEGAMPSSRSTRQGEDLEVVARNGLLDRRAFFKGGAAFAAAMTGYALS